VVAREFAIEMFIDRAAAGIAASATALDGLDAVVFTGGIGEGAPALRGRICRRLAPLGVAEPTETGEASAAPTSRSDRPAVIVVHAREDVVIARSALDVARR